MLKKNYLLTLLILIYLPLAFMLIWSFNSSSHKGNIISIFNHFTWDNYRSLFAHTTFLKAILLTLMISLISMAVSVIFALNVVFGMHKNKKSTNGLVLKTVRMSIAIPDIITAITFLILILIVLSVFHLHQGLLSAIIINIVFNVPYAILALWPRMKKLNYNLINASNDLGAKPFFTFTNVVVPFMYPAIIGACGITFAMSFDDFVITKFAIGNHYNTVSTMIYSMSRGIKSYTLAFSSLMLVTIISIGLFKNAYQYYSNKKGLK